MIDLPCAQPWFLDISWSGGDLWRATGRRTRHRRSGVPQVTERRHHRMGRLRPRPTLRDWRCRGNLSEIGCATKHTFEVLRMAIGLAVLTSRSQDAVDDRILSIVGHLLTWPVLQQGSASTVRCSTGEGVILTDESTSSDPMPSPARSMALLCFLNASLYITSRRAAIDAILSSATDDPLLQVPFGQINRRRPVSGHVLD